MITRKYLTISTIFVTLLLGSMACDHQRMYEQWVDIENFQWHQDSAGVFEFEVLDTTMLYNVNLGLRHLNPYPYQNIWIISELQKPDSTSFSDTIQYKIADEYGVWYGKRSAGIYTQVVRMYTGVKFASPGQYKFLIHHGMRDESLSSVASVGIRVEQN